MTNSTTQADPKPMEQKPFNGHTHLPWGMDRSNPDTEFAHHAANTYYEREAELSRLRGLLEEAEKAGTEIEKYSDCPYARGLARNLLSKLRK